MIHADKQKMEQVLYNLISNAVNYTGDDKVVKIKINDNEDGSCRVEVIDTGKGIKKEEIDLIWDKYYKSNKKHKRNMLGTGLGLSIVKNIFELHNYKYGVTSKKNKGSTFYFESLTHSDNMKYLSAVFLFFNNSFLDTISPFVNEG